jgi:hypothetical protein
MATATATATATALEAAIRDLYGIHSMNILAVMNKHVLELNPGKPFTAIYTEDESKMRRNLYERLKDIEIKKKGEELNGEGMTLLTKENLERWLTEGETYVSIATKRTGVSDKIVGTYAKMFGLTSFGNKKEVPVSDEKMLELVKNYSIRDILMSLEAILPAEPEESAAKKPASPTVPRPAYYPFRRKKLH